MFIQQLYTKCLAEAAYYIESNGEVAIIDPLRETSPYIDLAKRRSAKIKYIFETHFHADFVSGHVDLASKTGAEIVYGPTTVKPGYDAHIGYDGENFQLGNLQIQLIHTPGHTMESSCFLLFDEGRHPHALFSGDTLFIGDVGRPDLAQKIIADLTQEKLAAHLFESLRNKILPLPDHLIVYPGHGAGSACGKKMSNETTDTLGQQKKTNYALDPKLSKEEFIEKVLDGLMPPPAYFPQDVLLNIKGYESLEAVLRRAKAMDANDFEKLTQEPSVLIIDTRDPADFAQGHISGAINIGLNGSFAVWAGTIIRDISRRLAIICEPGTEQEVITRLSRVGFDHTIAYLFGGMKSWISEGKALSLVERISAEDFSNLSEKEKLDVLDVRKTSEYETQHLVGAINIPLDYLADSPLKIQPDKKYFVHCASGYRSMIFISILKNEGFKNLVNIDGGFNALKNMDTLNVTKFVEPLTLL